MKKKTKRQIKKLTKTIRRAWAYVAPEGDHKQLLLGASALGGSGLLLAAARDPRVRESVQSLIAAVSGVIERHASGQPGAALGLSKADDEHEEEEASEDEEDNDGVGHTH
jgi:hypothetical protein